MSNTTSRWLAVLACLGAATSLAEVKVAYQLPGDGPLPKTYRVTLAAVDPKNPNWIISQFARGQVRTVTTENGGKFEESWDGLDDNLMPVPPGSYAIKGIYMPADKWIVDGEYHSIVPKFAGGASSWQPTPEQWNKPEPFGGDPCGSPLRDVDVAPNGVAVFYYQYLENGLNNPLFDLNKPVGYEQFINAFGSGGAAGGSASTTDGKSIWSFSTDGGPKFVYRADGKPFGSDNGRYRPKVYKPEGWVTAMACWSDPRNGETCVYVAENGKIVERADKRRADRPEYVESNSDFANKIVILRGSDGQKLGQINVRQPMGVVARGGTLCVLHRAEDGAGWDVSQVPLQEGLPAGGLQKLFRCPAGITPADLEVDSHGRFYLSDSAANKVYRLDRSGSVTVTYGHLDRQLAGSYDPLTLMAPGKLATWKDRDGNDRLIIVENAGPNRVSEWSADGKLIRTFMSLQTKANDGYAPDPEHPQYIYLGGQQNWLTRFKIDYEQHHWTVDAVWPDVGNDPALPGFDHPQLIYHDGKPFLACARSYNVYRLDGERWVLSAGIIRRVQNNKTEYFTWHDTNGDGRVEEEEYRNTPLEMPGWLLRYHGDQWMGDLSLLALNQRGPDVWRLAPVSFDAHGNPVYSKWEKVLTDPIFAARLAGTADAIHGGNELDEAFSSDWGQAEQGADGELFVSARGGRNFSANEGAQYKLSRYVPDGKGNYKITWRTGRAALQGLAKEGEVYGAIHLWKPINGLLSVVDQSRCGILIYTRDGMYVDTIFPDGRRFGKGSAGVYPQPGEFFAGVVYPNRDNGKIYFGMGKYTPMLFEAVGWSLTDNPVHPLDAVTKNVTLAASDIASPPEVALKLRGGVGTAKLADVAPALGGAAMDGSLAGWDNCRPITFASDSQQNVEVRCLYDAEHLYLRWHVRLARAFEPRQLDPIERIFTHDRGSDTLSLYIQGDTNARPASGANGRPGDARIVFGIFQDHDKLRPVAVGLYQTWSDAGTANPITYRTPVGEAAYAHVGEIHSAQLAYQLDADKKGFVLTAKLPRRTIPGLPTLEGGLRTMVNFEATLGGHNKFWWANTDGSASRETYDEPTEARLYPGSWAPLRFASLEQGVVLRNWMICGPFGGPETAEFTADGNSKQKDSARRLFDSAKYSPDGPLDLGAVYSGSEIQGYWPRARSVRWSPATVAGADPRIAMGASFQLWYAATWIYAPEDLSIVTSFTTSPMANIRYTLNGQSIQPGSFVQTAKATVDRVSATLTAKQTLALKRGWNELRVRGYCIGYPPLRVGVELLGPAEALWKLRLSGTQPRIGQDEAAAAK